MDFLDLKFLLRLTEYKNYRTKLTGDFGSFKGKAKERDAVCDALGKDSLVDFDKEIDMVEITSTGESYLSRNETKEIDTVEITSTGKSLLFNLNSKQKEVEGVLNVNALKVLRKFGNKNKMKVTEIKVSKLESAERSNILGELEKQTFVILTYKRSKVQVSLTARGIESKQEEVEGVLDANALKALMQIDKAKDKIKATKVTALSATERSNVLEKLEKQTFVKFTYKPKTGGEVWLTAKGIEHLGLLNKHSLALRQNTEAASSIISPPSTPIIPPTPIIEPKPIQKPTDAEVLQIIQDLDREYRTNNYLPIFYLRDKLEPPFSREELDDVLYRFQRNEKIELSTLVHTENYTPEQRSAGIPKRSGGPIFYIILTAQ